MFHSVSNPAANGNNPIGISTKSPGLAKNHKCISSPQNHSRNLMSNHLHPLPGRPGGNCRKLHKKQQKHFRAKLCQRDLYPFFFFFLIPLPLPHLCRKKIHFHTCPSIHPFKKAGNLQAAHDRGESKWKTSKHHCCPGETLQDG